MEKIKINFITDIFLGISFIVTAITGVLIFLFLPGGVRQGRYQLFLGITKDVWSLVHNYAGIIFIILSIVHLILHGDWIVRMIKRQFSRKDK
jgi:cytochrome b subunit of formate dehydrogenase